MSWTTPATAVAGSVLTAAWLNTYSRDNTTVLKTSINDDGTLKPTATVTTTVTGTQNDFTPAGLALGVPAWTLRCNNATLLTITGLAAGVDGAIGYIESVGAGQVDLANQAAGSLAANRFINQVTGTISLAPGVGRVTVQYDAAATRWRVIAHEQGAWITRTFAAGNYTASAGTWTVASATRDAYWLRGRTLTYSFSVGGATSATPVTVKIAIPGGFVAAANDTQPYYVQANGSGAAEGGYATVAAAGTTVNCQRYGNTAFGTGTVTPDGVFTFEVQ